MAKVEYVDILPATSELFYRSLTAQDRFTHSRITKKVEHYSRKKKAGVSSRSLLPEVALAWNALTDGQRTLWTTAGAQRGLNGYRLFVQDKCVRIINEMAGNATPETLHQSWVGNLHVESPATGLKITQLHPNFYWVSKKVPGKKGMYEPVKVTENFYLPLVLSLNYKADLVSQGAGAFAKFYADVYSSYQGVDRTTRVEISLDLSSAWKNATATLSAVAGYVVGYSLFFELFNVRGDLYVDNVKATHSAQNWVRDTYCEDINQGFTRAFYQIPKNWAAISLPAGALYDSMYKDF